MSGGLDLGLDAGRARRAAPGARRASILISDGLANQGDAIARGPRCARAARAARGEYVLSTVGVGADFNEYLMTALADAGTGNYYYLADAATTSASVFAREFDAARTTVAVGARGRRSSRRAGVRVVDAAGYPLEPTGDGVRLPARARSSPARSGASG